MTSPALLPVHTLAADIAARRLSPVDLVDEFLTRIERLEPRLHAFVSVNAANARLAAEAADKAIRSGHAVGPLHGIPIAIKDLVEIEGEVAMGGTAAWRNRIAPRTATLMRRLMAAGMIPNFTSEVAKEACVEATQMSHAAASPIPPPSAAPCTRASVGVPSVESLR